MTSKPLTQPSPADPDPAALPPAGPGDRRTGCALADLAATEGLARRLAAGLAHLDGPLALCLWGTLGVGKTTLVRALIAAAAGRPVEVPSPTFTLVQVYDLPFGPLWHFDLYRLADPAEIVELGWDEALAEGVACVEWPDRLGGLLPPRRLDLALGFPAGPPRPGAEDRRSLGLLARGAAAATLIEGLGT